MHKLRALATRWLRTATTTGSRKVDARKAAKAPLTTLSTCRASPGPSAFCDVYKYNYSQCAAFSSNATAPTMSPTSVDALKNAIESAGAIVRRLKASGSSKDAVQEAVASLLSLKEQLAALDAMPLTETPQAASIPAATAHTSTPVSMDVLVTYCKAKGFIYPSSEIYSSYPGFFDYGPLGVELKNNIKREWWKEFVQKQEDVVGLDCSIISSPAVWEASGHVAGFSDPMVDCKVSKLRYRADQVFWGKLVPMNDPAVAAGSGSGSGSGTGSGAVFVSILDGKDMHPIAHAAAKAKAKANGVHGPYHPFAPLQDLTRATLEEYPLIPSPATGNAGDLTSPRDFNLMFQTRVGATATSEDSASVAYLRPETAQGIFTNFSNVQRTARKKIPFGIAQIGKAFRNEITPRNFTFRSREFEQMEIEYFISDNEQEWEGHYAKWLEHSWSWLLSMGLREQMLQRDVKTAASGLAHYARACTDITFQFPFGQQELMGVAARGNYDLTKHAKSSGEKLEYFDELEGRKYLPHVIEPSIGVDRLVLALLTSAYREEIVVPSDTSTSASNKASHGAAAAQAQAQAQETRVVLGLHPRLAPVSVAVFPLVSNKSELSNKAKNIFHTLQQRYRCEYDTAGAIGRRYRRADEIGTPFCITVDFDTLADDTVTVRYRDSMKQVRMPIAELLPFLTKEIDGIEF